MGIPEAAFGIAVSGAYQAPSFMANPNQRNAQRDCAPINPK
jgi:hypothetical protein